MKHLKSSLQWYSDTFGLIHSLKIILNLKFIANIWEVFHFTWQVPQMNDISSSRMETTYVMSVYFVLEIRRRLRISYAYVRRESNHHWSR